MKKILKYLGMAFIIFIAAVIILGNIGNILVSKKNKEYTQTLEGMIVEINKHLPHKGFDGFDFFIMNRVFLEGENVIWESTLDTTFFYPARESILPESMNGGILVSGDRSCAIDLDTILTNDFLKKSHQLDLLYYHLFARSSKPNKFYEEIMKRKFSQTWRVHSPFSDRQCEFTMTYDEQKKMEEYCQNNLDDVLQEFMSEYLKRQNRLLNVASNNADITMHMVDADSLIIFHCVLDKSYSIGGNKPITNLRNNQGKMLEALQEDFQSLPIFFGMKEICNRTNKNLLFRYIDWNKTDSLDYILF